MKQQLVNFTTLNNLILKNNMQLDLFANLIEPVEEQKEPQYFYTVSWEEKDINPKTLVHEQKVTFKTAHAVYTSLDQVHEILKFITSLYSYNGCHIITRHTQQPNLNCSIRKAYILFPG